MIKSTSILTTSLWALVIACVMAAFFSLPAAAQTATKLDCKDCIKSKQIKNGKVKGKDLKDGAVDGSKIADGSVSGGDMSSDISLGTSSDDGDLSVKNTAGTATVSLDGDTGNVTNLFSNIEGSSNGLIKAWAQIAADGSVIACWRCNRDPNETRRLTDGQYEVDFTPISTDIRERPRSATLDSRDGTNAVVGHIGLGDRTPDPSSLFVLTADNTGSLGDQLFTVFIY